MSDNNEMIESPEIKEVEISSINFDQENPRQITDEARDGLKASVQKFGVVDLPIVNKRDMKLLSGHQRLGVARDLGEQKVQAIMVDLEPSMAEALALTMNNRAVAGEWTGKVHELLERMRSEIPELYDQLKMDRLREEAVSTITKVATADSGEVKAIKCPKCGGDVEKKGDSVDKTKD